MTENTKEGDGQEDLTEGQDDESKTLAKVRKALKAEKARAEALETENSDFRTTRIKQREEAIASAVNGKDYPQSLVDSITSKVQDVTDEEFGAILVDLVGEEATPTEDASKETDGTEQKPVQNPATLGQELAAAASGGAKVSEIDRLMEAKSVDEVNAVAAELGLGDV